SYDPTTDGNSITTSIGSTVTTPTFNDVDLAGIYLTLDTKDAGNTRTNFGITEFVVGVPEPTSFSLIASSLAAFAVLGRRRRS
ncbi:MAG: PEP-CTERM sorting domain-containing protein, partial [Verrucomicrobiota bacterium]